MSLANLSKLWGTSVAYLKAYSYKYRVLSSIVFFVDIFFTLLLTGVAFAIRCPVGIYLLVVALISVVAWLFLTVILRSEYFDAWVFYRRNRDRELIREKFAIDENVLRSISYVLGNKTLPDNKDMQFYYGVLSEMCLHNIKNAEKIAGYLEKYKSEDGVSCLLLKVRRKVYFIGIE